MARHPAACAGADTGLSESRPGGAALGEPVTQSAELVETFARSRLKKSHAPKRFGTSLSAIRSRRRHSRGHPPGFGWCVSVAGTAQDPGLMPWPYSSPSRPATSSAVMHRLWKSSEYRPLLDSWAESKKSCSATRTPTKTAACSPALGIAQAQIICTRRRVSGVKLRLFHGRVDGGRGGAHAPPSSRNLRGFLGEIASPSRAKS